MGKALTPILYDQQLKAVKMIDTSQKDSAQQATMEYINVQFNLNLTKGKEKKEKKKTNGVETTS